MEVRFEDVMQNIHGDEAESDTKDCKSGGWSLSKRGRPWIDVEVGVPFEQVRLVMIAGAVSKLSFIESGEAFPFVVAFVPQTLVDVGIPLVDHPYLASHDLASFVQEGTLEIACLAFVALLEDHEGMRWVPRKWLALRDRQQPEASSLKVRVLQHHEQAQTILLEQPKVV